VKYGEDNLTAHAAQFFKPGSINRHFIYINASVAQRGSHHGARLQADFALCIGTALEYKDATGQSAVSRKTGACVRRGCV
jgi:hypothetical protein